MSIHLTHTFIAIQVPFCAVVCLHDSQKGEGPYELQSHTTLCKAHKQQEFSAFSFRNKVYNRWRPAVNYNEPRTAAGKEQRTMTTSKREASQAGKDLRNPNTPKRDRGPIASDLAQTKREPKK
jgi:hypothetical protein